MGLLLLKMDGRLNLMRPDCHDLILGLYPWLSQLMKSPENTRDGILNIGALNTFEELYLSEDARDVYKNSIVILVKAMGDSPESVNEAFRDINYGTRCLDLCFRYSDDILILVVGLVCEASCPLEQISPRLKSIMESYDLGSKILVGRADPVENISKTILRLASVIIR